MFLVVVLPKLIKFKSHKDVMKTWVLSRSSMWLGKRTLSRVPYPDDHSRSPKKRRSKKKNKGYTLFSSFILW